MAIVRWEPFGDMDALYGRMNRMFGDTPLFRTTGTHNGGWVPAVDIREDEHEIEVKAEMPDMDEKDIDVKIDNNVLTLSGERKLEHEEEEDNYRILESRYGSFSRSFTLPTTVDTEKIKAGYEKGVLRVTLPKKEETKPKKIEIKPTKH